MLVAEHLFTRFHFDKVREDDLQHRKIIIFRPKGHKINAEDKLVHQTPKTFRMKSSLGHISRDPQKAEDTKR